MTELQKIYHEEIAKKLQSEFSYKSIMEVPKLTKITINMGVGEAVGDKKVLAHALSDMELISGQKPQPTLAKKSIAGFKIREEWPIGCKVTLRKNRMYEFFERLIKITCPRIRDFRGFSHKSFDGRGNYSFGIKEQIVFTEIDYDKIDTIRGMDITITTTAKTNLEAYALLKAFGFPLKPLPEKISELKDQLRNYVMAKKSVEARNKVREILSNRFADMRSALRKTIKTDPEGRDAALIKLQKRKRNESKVRVRNRCKQCGRGHGTYRRFGLCRICLREAAMRGDVPGLKKASW